MPTIPSTTVHVRPERPQMIRTWPSGHRDAFGAPAQFFVYRLYTATGDLLYVGVTYSVGGRMTEHRTKPWFHLVRRVEYESYRSMRVAQAAELDYIRRLHPRFNVKGRRA